jgi:flagellar biosynthesis chaperone FliJ
VAEPRFSALFAFLEREEEAARRVVAAREREREELLARAAGTERARSAAAAASTISEREQLARYWTASGVELQGIHQALAACEGRIVQARAALHEAHRQVATFAKLRARDQRAEARRQALRFAGQLDEFAATRTSEARLGQESGP